jgi:hypothetical protein
VVGWWFGVWWLGGFGALWSVVSTQQSEVGVHSLLSTVVEFNLENNFGHELRGTGSLMDNLEQAIQFGDEMAALLEKEKAKAPTACGTRGTAPMCDCRSTSLAVTAVNCNFLCVFDDSNAMIYVLHSSGRPH